MGVKHGNKVMYTIAGLRYCDVGAICKGLASSSTMPNPTIDVDCSNVSYKAGKTAQGVANHLTKWSQIGVEI